MTKRILDEKGKACPQPVIEAKNMLADMEAGEELEVVVDNSIAVENIVKMATQMHLQHTWTDIDSDEYRIVITQKKQEVLSVENNSAGHEGGSWVVAISSDTMGTGDDVLGRVLMKGFIYAVTELDPLPETILFYNGGARLTAEGSESLEDLMDLEDQGVEILTCGTCIDFLGLDKTPKIGGVSNMYTIAEIMGKAAKVVRP
ncbi:sulfurtransferase-like selenium metabolism protein YedF [Alkalibacter rhizosphaerae]|uniref:Sulfurtransferase-like selenium metabolism protein YedF n=1 Tax=Alkalibacter rhizosphaerae TaxID=2815577 RepID=A0A975AHY4_9FIRM|nr:sulfurtransferase-like selenium metabolism protein YedF [Alkalibacter rhizosphaerae]QSX09094.1 sulfurtransferase-like selenium metabolism protein YedF [Alkalibacter rhizosphaerae]